MAPGDSWGRVQAGLLSCGLSMLGHATHHTCAQMCMPLLHNLFMYEHCMDKRVGMCVHMHRHTGMCMHEQTCVHILEQV